MRRLSSSNWLGGPIAIAALLVGLCETRARGESTWFLPLDGSVRALSDDGRTVVGFTGDADIAAIWELPSGARRDLSELPVDEYALGVSADGSVVVGSTWTRDHGSTSYSAFRWTEAQGRHVLPQLLPFHDYGYGASVVSGDGAIVFGGLQESPLAGIVIWEGDHDPTLVPGTSHVASGVLASSYDGTVFVGARDGRAVLWDRLTGAVELDVAEESIDSFASDVTPDGQVVLGNLMRVDKCNFNLAYEPFIWTEDDGLHMLPSYSAACGMWVQEIAADGQRAVGAAFNQNENGEIQSVAVILGPGGNWRRVDEWLTSQGLGDEIAGWQLTNANSISADGKTITGWRNISEDLSSGWVAHVPEPGSGPMLLIGIVFACHACRRTSTSMGKRWSAAH